MPRFYLHIRDGDRLLEDPDGSMLPDLDTARAEALEGAREILSDRVKAGQILNGQRFEITDEAGTVLSVVPLREAIKLA